jgi:hypothetical protein
MQDDHVITTVRRLIARGVTDFRISLSRVGPWALDVYDRFREHGSWTYYAETARPCDIFLLVAKALQGENVTWRFDISSEYLDESFRDAIASVVFDETSRLVELDITGSHHSDHIARLIVPPSSIRTLHVCYAMLASIPLDPRPSLDGLCVSRGGDMSVIGPFVRTAGVTSLLLDSWPEGSIEDLPGIQRIEIDRLHWPPGPIEPLCRLIAACPNLTVLTMEHMAWNDGGESLRAILSHIKDMENLILPSYEDSIPVILPTLARMKSLRELHICDCTIRPELMEAIAWHLPRLTDLWNDGVVYKRYPEAIGERNDWLQRVALVSYLPLGDIHRELAAYL